MFQTIAHCVLGIKGIITLFFFSVCIIFIDLYLIIVVILLLKLNEN